MNESQSFKSLIEAANSILVLLPVRPTLDQVSSGLALYLALSKTDKNIQISCPTPMIVDFNRLIGVDKITQELGNKNLVIRFQDYKATDIERVSYDIENGQFRLTVIPKPKITPPVKESVDLSYSGISADLILLVGGTNMSHFPDIANKDFIGAKLVHIGTNDLDMSNRDVLSIARPASSISELIAKYLKEAEFKIDEDIATNLLAGIEQTTGSFSSPSMGPDSFMIIAELMRLGGRRIEKVVPMQMPQGFIPQNQQKGAFPAMPIPQVPQNMNFGGSIDPENPDDEAMMNPPNDWLKPKIYKGTSVS